MAVALLTEHYETTTRVCMKPRPVADAEVPALNCAPPPDPGSARPRSTYKKAGNMDLGIPRPQGYRVRIDARVGARVRDLALAKGA